MTTLLEIPTSMNCPPSVWWQWTAIRFSPRMKDPSGFLVHRYQYVCGGASRRPGGKYSVQVDLAVLIVETGERKVLEVIGPQPSQVKLLPEPDIGRPPRRAAAEPARSRTPGRIVEIHRKPVRRRRGGGEFPASRLLLRRWQDG